jgi:SAM-dependent MidA family methyltransferase
LDVAFLQTGNPALIELIRAEIQKRGPVSFAWFMDQALYHPEHGYYSSGRCAIGRHGDYFTNVSVGPLFGRLLTAQFAEMWERLGETGNFIVVEQGAHHGDFARDVLESARDCYADFFSALRYRIIEPFPVLQDRQSQTLQSFRDKVEWRDSIEPFVGVHFSNELVDAMPVRLIGPHGEKLVSLQNNEFVLVDSGVEDAQGVTVSEQSRRKPAFNQAALDWIENVAANLQRGYVIAIDYGHGRPIFREEPSDIERAPRASAAAVQVRAQHRFLGSAFERIGHADITTHVNWTTIVECAQRNGLRIAGFTDQHHFLTGIISELSRDGSSEPPASDWGQSPLPAKMKRELQTLLHPEMLGRTFQVLALAKNVDTCSLRLAGFRFAREPSYPLDL